MMTKDLLSPALQSVRTLLLLGIAAAMPAAVLTGAWADDDAPTQLDLSTVPGELVDDVVLPVPHEIFHALEKLGPQDWNSQIRPQSLETPPSRTRAALLFGLVLANGFIAVEAENRDEVRRIGRDVVRFSEALGVKQAVMEHAQSIIDAANDQEWQSVRRELDRTRETVLETMEKLRDDDLAHLVSLGGWLGGADILAALAGGSPAAVELLHQPDLVEQLTRSCRKMPPALRSEPVMREVERVLQELQPLLRKADGGGLPPADLQRVQNLTSELIRLIEETADNG